jgi:hypothetical protein
MKMDGPLGWGLISRRPFPFIGNDRDQSADEPPALQESQAGLGRSHACPPRNHQGRGFLRVRPGREAFLQLGAHAADERHGLTATALRGAALPEGKGTQRCTGVLELLFQAGE